MTRTTQRRPGFTLVELMVAAGLMILMMAIIATAFQSSLQTLSHLRTIGNLADRLRIAQERLRNDLETEHFEHSTLTRDRPLSQYSFDSPTVTQYSVTPTAGYFRIEQANGSIHEGNDADGLPSTRNVTTALEFTSRRLPRSTDAQFTSLAPELEPFSLNDTGVGENYIAEWARVRWSLGNPTTVDGVTTYTLYRGSRLLANVGNIAIASVGTSNFVSVNAGVAQTLADVTPLANRVRSVPPAPPQQNEINPFPIGHPNYGDDIVLTNVLSMEVKVNWNQNPAWNPVDGGNPATAVNRQPRRFLPLTATGAEVNRTTIGAATDLANPDFPFDDMPVAVFDTSPMTPNDPNTMPFRARINAIQIKLRVYDIKNKVARQVTMVFPL
jgi:type II secretory pathway pseudopilin PulG